MEEDKVKRLKSDDIVMKGTYFHILPETHYKSGLQAARRRRQKEKG